MTGEIMSDNDNTYGDRRSYVKPDGKLLNTIETFSYVELKDIHGNHLMMLYVADCTSLQQIQFRSLAVLWSLHRKEYPLEQVKRFLSDLYSGFPDVVEEFLLLAERLV